MKNELRAPAYPLVTIDPYTSAWAFQDNLYDGAVKHWTGKSFPLIGVAKVDGQTYRFMGAEELELNSVVPNSEQEDWVAKYTVYNRLKGGRIWTLMIAAGKKAKLLLEPWRMSILPRRNGVKSIFGYAEL